MYTLFNEVASLSRGHEQGLINYNPHKLIKLYI